MLVVINIFHSKHLIQIVKIRVFSRALREPIIVKVAGCYKTSKAKPLNSSFQKLGTPSNILFCNLKTSNSVQSSGLITKKLVIMRFFSRYLISFSFQNWKLINKSVTQLKASTLKYSTTYYSYDEIRKTNKGNLLN